MRPGEESAPTRLGRREILGLVGILLVGLGYRLLFFNGIRGHDDFVYLFYARSILNGITGEAFSSLWGIRLGMVLPLVGLFKAFGPSFFLAFLCPMLLSIGSIGLVFALAWRLFGERKIAVAAAGLFAISPLDTFVASTIRGDAEVGFFSLLALVLIVEARRRDGRRAAALFTAAGAAIGVAYDVKEAGLLALVAAGALFAFDSVWKGRARWSYAFVVPGFLLVLVLEGAILFAVTGNPFQKVQRGVEHYELIAKEGGFQEDLTLSRAYLPCLLLSLPGERCEKLLTSGDWNNTYTPFGVFGPLAVLAAVALVLRRERRAFPLLVWAGTILLTFQFGSMSYRSYLPFHKEPRYLTLVTGAAAVLLAAGLVTAAKAVAEPRWRRAALACLGVLLVGDSIRILTSNHATYVRHTRFNGRIASFFLERPDATVYADSYIVQYVELVSGYAYPSPAHRFRGKPGFGLMEDTAFFDCGRATDGSYYVTTTGLRPECGLVSNADWERVLFVPGEGANLEVFRREARQERRDGSGEARIPTAAGPLGRHHLVRATQSHGELRFDRNFNGEPISLGGVAYMKGLGTHSRSEIEYVIPEGIGTFSASVGLDDSEDHSPGSVVFRVFVDNDLQFESSVLRWDSRTVGVRVSVAGHRRLRLVVDDGGDGDTCDHATWADARFEEGESTKEADGGRPHAAVTVVVPANGRAPAKR